MGDKRRLNWPRTSAEIDVGRKQKGSLFDASQAVVQSHGGKTQGHVMPLSLVLHMVVVHAINLL